MKKNLSWKWVGYSFLFVYAVFLIIMVFHHEALIDETQAWNIARDLPFFDMLKQMQQEGHPCLWHLILMPFAKLGFPVMTVSIISSIFMWLTAYLILFKSPFHPITRLCIVFSCPFLYLYSINSRVYVLIPFLLALIGMCYKKRKENPYLYCTLLGLLANTHIVMLGLSGMLFLGHFFEFVFKQKTENRIKHITGLFIILLFYLILILQINQSLSSNTMLDSFGFNYISEQNLWFNIKRFFEKFLIVFADQFHQILGMDILLSWVNPIFFVFVLLVIIFMKFYKTTIPFFIGYIFSIAVSAYIWFLNTHRACLIIIFGIFYLWYSYLEYSHHKLRLVLLQVIISVLCLATIPFGTMKAYNDYVGLSSGSKIIASYVEKNIQDDAIIILTNHQLGSPVAGYIPNKEMFYNPFQERFFTFESWEDFQYDIFDQYCFLLAVKKFSDRELYLLHSYMIYDSTDNEIEKLKERGYLKELLTTDISEENENYVLYRVIIK